MFLSTGEVHLHTVISKDVPHRLPVLCGMVPENVGCQGPQRPVILPRQPVYHGSLWAALPVVVKEVSQDGVFRVHNVRHLPDDLCRLAGRHLDLVQVRRISRFHHQGIPDIQVGRDHVGVVHSARFALIVQGPGGVPLRRLSVRCEVEAAPVLIVALPRELWQKFLDAGPCPMIHNQGASLTVHHLAVVRPVAGPVSKPVLERLAVHRFRRLCGKAVPEIICKHRVFVPGVGHGLPPLLRRHLPSLRRISGLDFSGGVEVCVIRCTPCVHARRDGSIPFCSGGVVFVQKILPSALSGRHFNRVHPIQVSLLPFLALLLPVEIIPGVVGPCVF